MTWRTKRVDACRAGAVLAAVLGASTVHAGTLFVPTSYATIQDAVDAAADGDQIIVADGTYLEDVDVVGKQLTLRSVSGDPELCTLVGFTTGVYIGGADADVTLLGLTIRDCPTWGVVVALDGKATIQSCIVEECTSAGALTMNGSELEIVDSVFQDNATSGAGGALLLGSGDTTIERTLFRDNVAGGDDAFGGAIHVGSQANLTMVDCDVLYNRAIGSNSGRGGGLYVAGGVLLDPITIANTRFFRNAGSEYGGGVYIEGRHAVLSNLKVTENLGGAGGGMWFENTGAAIPMRVLLGNSIVARNEATDGSGGGLRQTSDMLMIVTNATILDNTSDAGGGGVANRENSEAVFTNCIIRGNSPDDLGGLGERTVRYSNIGGGYDGVGNINYVPGLVDRDGGNYRLEPDSVCIDAGTTAGYFGPPLDLDGNVRAVDDPDTANTGVTVDGAGIDMGAYEFQPDDGVCLGDLNGDGSRGFGDLTILLNAWGVCP